MSKQEEKAQHGTQEKKCNGCCHTNYDYDNDSIHIITNGGIV